MPPIALRPGLWLVGSGIMGFGLTAEADCHVYLLDGAEAWALIDAGSGVKSDQIVANIQQSGVDTSKPGHVLLTHAHGDHSGGAADIAEALPSASVWAAHPAAEWIARGDEEGASVDRGKAQGVYSPEYVLKSCPTVRTVRDGAVFALEDGLTVRAVETPGHSDGHVCYYAEGRGLRALFSGDCVFTQGRVSIQNLHDTRVPVYASSVRRLVSLAPSELFPGHHSIALSDAVVHISSAMEAFDGGRLPPNES